MIDIIFSQISLVRCILYIVFQCVGGILGALFLKAITCNWQVTYATTQLGETEEYMCGLGKKIFMILLPERANNTRLLLKIALQEIKNLLQLSPLEIWCCLPPKYYYTFIYINMRIGVMAIA